METTAEEAVSQMGETFHGATDGFAAIARGTTTSADGVCGVNLSTRCADLPNAREATRDFRKTAMSFE